MSDQKSMNELLNASGIKTVRTKEFKNGRNIVYLEFNGKRIVRPFASSCAEKCRNEFGVDIYGE